MLRYVIIMGVAGCGKSSVGKRLSQISKMAYLDGDDLHPPANIAKMSKGLPLNDDDRWPWLTDIGTMLEKSSQPTAIGCSALKYSYRDHIRKTTQKPVCFIHLVGERDLIAKRMAARTGHFMPTTLIDSQFADLEPLSTNELGAKFDISQDLEMLTRNILNFLETETT